MPENTLYDHMSMIVNMIYDGHANRSFEQGDTFGFKISKVADPVKGSWDCIDMLVISYEHMDP